MFSDCLEDYWAEDFIHTIYYGGVTMGCLLMPTLQYCPTNPVTREQMAAFIVRAVEGEPLTNYCGGIQPFNDVLADSPFCGYIKRLSELNITQGCAAGMYCPTDNVLRQQMAAFLVRAIEGEPLSGYCDTGVAFTDVETTSVFCKYIKRLVELARHDRRQQLAGALDDDDSLRWKSDAGERNSQPARDLAQRIQNLLFKLMPASYY